MWLCGICRLFCCKASKHLQVVATLPTKPLHQQRPSSLSPWDCGAEQGLSACRPLWGDGGQEGARPYRHLCSRTTYCCCGSL